MFSVLQYAQFWVFSGIRVSRAISSCCRCVSVLRFVFALNWKIQNEACISAAKYTYSPFFLEVMLKLILDYLTRTKGKELMDKVPKQ